MSDKVTEHAVASVSAADDDIDLRIEEKLCAEVQTRIYEVKFEREHQFLQTSFQISNGFLNISVFSHLS